MAIAILTLRVPPERLRAEQCHRAHEALASVPRNSNPVAARALAGMETLVAFIGGTSLGLIELPSPVSPAAHQLRNAAVLPENAPPDCDRPVRGNFCLGDDFVMPGGYA